MSEATTYWKVSSEMTSMMGQTTVLLSLATSVRSGSNQPSVHSTWESRNVRTDPVAAFAPTNLALMSPSLSTDLRTFTVTPSPET